MPPLGLPVPSAALCCVAAWVQRRPEACSSASTSASTGRSPPAREPRRACADPRPPSPPHPPLPAPFPPRSYILWGVGVPLSFSIMTIYYRRLSQHNLPPAELVVSSFLPVGVCKQVKKTGWQHTAGARVPLLPAAPPVRPLRLTCG